MGETIVVATNKKAYHEYFVLEKYEAGISLSGTEVKSIRRGKVNLKESYVRIDKGEMFVHSMHISPYEEGNRFNRDPLRVRKLLMHKQEIIKLMSKVQEKGLALVPLRLYINDCGKVKLEIALAKGKKLYDKRQDAATRDAKREIERSIKARD